MSDILTFNQNVFGGNTKERSISKRTKKAKSKELYTPIDSEIITYDEGFDLDGGWFLGIKVGASTCRQVFNSISSSCSLKVMTGMTIGGFVLKCASLPFALAVTKIEAALASIWTKFVALVSTSGPVGWIIGGVTAIVAISAASIFAGILYAGAGNESFRAGWEINLTGPHWKFGSY